MGIDSSVHFWSSTEYTSFMTGLIDSLNAQGVKAVQRFHVSSKVYRGAKGMWARLWLRFRMYGLYPLHLMLAVLLGRRGTIYVVCSNTFYAPFLVTLLARVLRVRVVHLLYDLFPEVLELSGKSSRSSLISRVTRWMNAFVFRHADANVFLGDHLLSYVKSEYQTIKNPAVIHVGASNGGFEEVVVESVSEKPVILYSGNMGYMHEVETLASVLNESLELVNGLEFKFHAIGRGYQIFQELLSEDLSDRISLQGGLVHGDWLQVMCSADVALVTMIQGAERVLMPSKTYSALMAGQAILAVAPAHSDLAELVRMHDCGWVVEPGDQKALKEVLQNIPMERDTVLRKRQNARRAGVEFYSSEFLAGEWKRLFESLQRN